MWSAGHYTDDIQLGEIFLDVGTYILIYIQSLNCKENCTKVLILFSRTGCRDMFDSYDIEIVLDKNKEHTSDVT